MRGAVGAVAAYSLVLQLLIVAASAHQIPTFGAASGVNCSSIVASASDQPASHDASHDRQAPCPSCDMMCCSNSAFVAPDAAVRMLSVAFVEIRIRSISPFAARPPPRDLFVNAPVGARAPPVIG